MADTTEFRKVLLHKRRVNETQARGEQSVFVCADCFDAFSPLRPQLCKYCLANDLWLERWLPLFRNANLTHQMLLALARIVTTKVVLRPEGNVTKRPEDGPSWDFLFHQAGMVGSAILFGNSSCKEAVSNFPPQHVQDSFAVTFVGKLESYGATSSHDSSLDHNGLDKETQKMQSEAKKRVKGIAKLKVDRREFDAQAQRLQEWNVVHENTQYQQQLVAQWCPDPNIPEVPQIIVDNVVAIPVEEDPGKIVASGPADATASGEMDKADADVEAAKQARYISAFDPESLPGAGESAACLELTSLQQQLEDLEATDRTSWLFRILRQDIVAV